MESLIIYDSVGDILITKKGTTKPLEPQGVPFMWAEIPDDKILKSVDVTQYPHKLTLEDIPPSEIDQLKQTVADLTEIVLSGGM